MYLDLIGPEKIRNGVGYLNVVTGGMKADKTKHFAGLFDRLRHTDIKMQIFKPKCDFRRELHEKYDIPRGYTVSRTGLYVPSEEIDDKGDLSDLVQEIDLNNEIFGFEEVHLYDKSEKVVNICLWLKYEHKKTVVTSLLDRNFRGEPYKAAQDLMSNANGTDKLFGWCDVKGCNEVGEMSQRLIDGQPAPWDDVEKLVGASETYEARCMNHHEVPGKPRYTV
tara:strand:+ start:19369 stop:20034 length:666 start_codon:yes stop_codon:yes gene_type:complete